MSESFQPVWLQTDLPRASMTARGNTLIGTLTIDTDCAEFRSDDVVMRLGPVRRVLVGRRGSDYFNRWIELAYGDSDQPSIVYLNDGGWRGWRPILMRTTRKIGNELSSLIAQS